MKIVTAQEIARLEQSAYAEGASEEKFMERAGRGVAEIVQRAIAFYHLSPIITLLCGSGNNGGDAYVAGTHLLKGGFQVRAISAAREEKMSHLCLLQSQRFSEAGGRIDFADKLKEASFEDSALLIDGLLGTGFHGEVDEPIKGLIQKANSSNLPIIAVDIPSGINGTTGEVSQTAIHATETVFLGLPKSGCFAPEAWALLGRIHIYNFGLSDQLIEGAQEIYWLIDDALIRTILPSLNPIRHKYQTGYVVGLGGSPGMPGAAIMSSLAALRSGAGIVRLFHPLEMKNEFSHAPLELVRETYQDADLTSLFKEVKRAKAVFIGPGMGNSDETYKVLSQFLSQLDKPVVIDADALVGIKKQGLSFPSQAILTPHHGEMEKLLGEWERKRTFQELLEQSILFAREQQVTLVLKGAPTYIIHRDLPPYVCPNGDPGMATAGSGDILTGIIAGFLAQTQDPFAAALLGVKFHAMAGELAAEKWTSYAMIATDLLPELPAIFKHYDKIYTSRQRF